MRGLQQIFVTVTLAAGLALASGAAQAAKFKVLHSFCCRDGSNPYSALVTDQAGNLYGTTPAGGPVGRGQNGTAFEFERKPGGSFKFKVLYQFSEGEHPSGSLIVDAQGNLYGLKIPRAGGAGAAYKLSPQIGKKKWSERVLYYFCSQQNCTDGSNPFSSLTYAGASSGAPYDGVSALYGTTTEGGANNGGTVFELTSNGSQWTEAVLYNFCSQGGDKCVDGKEPLGGLLVDVAGNLYGTAAVGGGNAQAGTAFELAKNSGTWDYTVLYHFCSMDGCADGEGPIGPFVMDSQRNLFGATGGGGRICKEDKVSGCGTIFKLTPSGATWQETVLYAFCAKKGCKDGRGLGAGVTMDSLGNLYGTTVYGGGNDIDQDGAGGGTIFKFNETGLGTLHRFCASENCVDGEFPRARLILDPSGNLYGTTEYGGAYGNRFVGGVVFRVTP